MNGCVRCRDWGTEESHADHWPPRTATLLAQLAATREADQRRSLADLLRRWTR